MRRDNSGFSTLELLAFFIIIAVLSAFIAFAYRGVEARNHNTARSKAVNAIHKQLEAYYQTENHYPSLRDLNDAKWLAANLKGLDTDLLVDPTGKTTSLAQKPTADQYAYSAKTSDGQSCEQDDTKCMSYQLTATLEGGGTYNKQNTD